ncbi:probable serine/threonine-protein kinase PIX13 [Mangifera indica]|uniref:probable serine/threonine-protein kinase PIX13 n=1 Tax=Mangifera indica TaxID=29780 RepID=UPI001CFAB99E|nr:probable serine/threonine-protein kinase PIX13 [Mangifera indica]
MGICYGTPVDHHSHIHSHSPETTKPSTPDVKLVEKKPINDPEEKIVVDDMPSSGQIVTPNMKMFTLEELRAATKNFKPATVLGEGGFGRVFKGWVDEKTYAPSKAGVGMAVAVKKSNPDSLQGLEEWQAEVKFLGKFSHPNLVKLLGYCWEDRLFLLVYEYMQKGSLENHLFRNGAEPLSWDIRLKIAIGAAKGLTFLHSSEKSVIYRDFKASNILLDAEYNAKLSDFGLAKFGPINGNSHVTTRVMGTYGYAAPEYVATGHLYVKSDVYGFGVVLLEMLTGLRTLDTNRPSGKHNLVEYMRPSLSGDRKLKKIMDPRLADQYPAKAAAKAAELILKCLESDPKSRPSMDQVLETLEKIRAIEADPKKVRAKAKRHQEDHHGHHQPPMPSKHGDNGTRARGSHRPSMVR